MSQTLLTFSDRPLHKGYPGHPMTQADRKEIQDELEVLRFEAAETMTGEQLRFIEAMVDAAQNVEFLPAKFSARAIAMAALRGPDALRRFMPFVRTWCSEELARSIAEKLKGGRN
jgi:hypothetical protein